MNKYCYKNLTNGSINVALGGYKWKADCWKHNTSQDMVNQQELKNVSLPLKIKKWKCSNLQMNWLIISTGNQSKYHTAWSFNNIEYPKKQDYYVESVMFLKRTIKHQELMRFNFRLYALQQTLSHFQSLLLEARAQVMKLAK